MAEVVTYDGLPASAGGAHSLRARKPDVAWGQVRWFVDACAQPMSTPTLAFEVRADGPADLTERMTAHSTELLGGARRRARTHTEWNVRPDAVDSLIAALDDAGGGAVTRDGHPLASLVWSAQVALVDPATGEPYEGIAPDEFGRFAADGYGRVLGASGVRATIGTTGTSLSLWLNFPSDERLPAAAAHIRDHAPVRLSAKHWRRWSPTRDGAGYRSAKIPSPLE